MASMAALSQVGEREEPWTDESKQMALARSPPTPKDLFKNNDSGPAAESGAGRLEKVELFRSDSSSVDSFCKHSVDCDGEYPGDETSSEKRERREIERELRVLATT